MLLNNDEICNNIEVDGNVFENSRRKVVIVKLAKSYQTFITLINYYLANLVIDFSNDSKIKNYKQVVSNLPKANNYVWKNIGGQLMISKDVESLLTKIKTNNIGPNTYRRFSIGNRSLCIFLVR